MADSPDEATQVIEPFPSRRGRRRPGLSLIQRVFIIAFCLGMAGLMLLVDIPVAAFAKHGTIPRVVRDILENLEWCGHAVGVIAILLGIWVLDRPRRVHIPRIALCSIGGGIAADVVKMLVSRARPRDSRLLEIDVWQTFGGWLPLFGSSVKSHSFPSAHTSTAFGFALAMSCYYPRGVFYFFTLATLVGCQRVSSSAHFPSDVFAGAALGLTIAWIALRGQWKSSDDPAPPDVR